MTIVETQNTRLKYWFFDININILKYWYRYWYWFCFLGDIDLDIDIGIKKNIDLDIDLDLDFLGGKLLISILILKFLFGKILILILIQNLILSHLWSKPLDLHGLMGFQWKDNIHIFHLAPIFMKLCHWLGHSDPVKKWTQLASPQKTFLISVLSNKAVLE